MNDQYMTDLEEKIEQNLDEASKNHLEKLKKDNDNIKKQL